MLFGVIQTIMRGGQISFQAVLMQIFALLLVIFLVLPLHEGAHALVSSLLGDKGVKYRGRLTLNPVSHIDPMGALCLILFGFGWAKPVPVDPRYYKNPKVGMAITALAGPLSNILAAFVGLLIYTFIVGFVPLEFLFSEALGYISVFFQYFVILNISLAVFNLIPVPPLDGSKILFAFLPDRIIYQINRYQQYYVIAIFVLLWVGVLDVPLDFLSNSIYMLLNNASEFIVGLFTTRF